MSLWGQGPELCFAMRIVALVPKGARAVLEPAETGQISGAVVARSVLAIALTTCNYDEGAANKAASRW